MLALRATALGILLAFAAVACGDGEATEEAAPEEGGFGVGGTGATPPGLPASPGATTAASPPTTTPTSPTALATDVDPQTTSHPEVVYVLMKGKDGWTWFCTGTLVAPRVVVTAAHCLNAAQFLSWEVFAPTLAAKPRVAASAVHMFDAAYKDVTKPDLGIVELSADIPLTQYPELVDVSAQVDAGKDTRVMSIVRTAEKPEAPLARTATMKMTSTQTYGYTHGFGVPLFSHGGDSGAGLFLVENGQPTHKLVAVAREPDPARKLDQLSRVETGFAAWVHQTGGF